MLELISSSTSRKLSARYFREGGRGEGGGKGARRARRKRREFCQRTNDSQNPKAAYIFFTFFLLVCFRFYCVLILLK